MSKYWKKMEILRRGGIYGNKTNTSNDKSLYLGQERPAFFVNKSMYKLQIISQDNNSEEVLHRLSKFYRANYKIGNNINTIQVSTEEINRYIQIGADIITIHKDRLIGSSISLYLPIRIVTQLDQQSLIERIEEFNAMGSDDSIILGCCSFLVLERKFRGKGFGMSLIQESLQKFYDKGGLTAFFVNKDSRCDNSVSLVNWYFPLNLAKLDSCGYVYPKQYKSLFTLDKPTNEIIKINETNAEMSWVFYMKLISNKRFVFAPSLNFWKKWILSFPTYMVRDNSDLIGVFSLNSSFTYHPIYRETLSTGTVMICIGKQPETLQNALYQAKESFDILGLYQAGDLTARLLAQVYAQKMSTNYINFFNTRIKLSAADFYVPIF